MSLNWDKNDRHELTLHFSGILVSVKTFTCNSKIAFILIQGRSRKFDLPFHSQLGNRNGVFFVTMLKTNVPK